MGLINDPRQFVPSDCPKFISKSGVDFVSETIQWKTGLWNHSMLMRTPGKVVWQGLQVVEKPIDLYMKRYVRMDFFSLIDKNPQAIAAMNAYINAKMNGPWYKQTYDFLGIFGQAIGCPWIHTPGLAYCSVFELSVLRAGAPFMSADASKVIMSQKIESDPQDMHDMYVANPKVFNYDGGYEGDDGVIL